MTYEDTLVNYVELEYPDSKHWNKKRYAIQQDNQNFWIVSVSDIERHGGTYYGTWEQVMLSHKVTKEPQMITVRELKKIFSNLIVPSDYANYQI
jgi:hypothetical protein